MTLILGFITHSNQALDKAKNIQHSIQILIILLNKIHPMRKLNKIFSLLAICFITTTLSAQPFPKAVVSNVKAINTETLDFSPALHKDGIVFLSNSDIKGKNKMFDKDIQQRTMSLFMSRRNAKGLLESPEPFAIELVSEAHEGPLTFEKDFKTVYLSRNNVKHETGKAQYADDNIDYMKIFVSYLGEKGWSTPKEMSINIPQTDACHPALSPDGKRLYFSSNRPGGYGGMDLYVCEKTYGGQWTKPVNLGEKINSKDNDVFPFVNLDGMLYFSSNRADTEGGLDIYYYNLNQDNKSKSKPNPLASTKVTNEPISLGRPFNSPEDDFGFIIDATGKSGYFTSGRIGGMGLDDIYSFNLPDEKRKVTITVLDRNTRTPLSKSDICVSNTSTEKPIAQNAKADCNKLLTDEKGKSDLSVTLKDNYFLTINQTGYKPETTSILKDDRNDDITILMEKKEELPHQIVFIVLDLKTKKPIPDAELCLTNKTLNTDAPCEKQQTNATGKAPIKVLNNSNYAVKISKLGYRPVQAGIPKNDSRNEITVFMEATDEIVAVVKPVSPTPIPTSTSASVKNTEKPITNSRFIDLPESDYDQVYCLRHIYYDYDKATIRADAKFVMDSLIEILKHFPEMEIEMAAHTDTRGNAKYNQALSERRVVSVEQFLENQSINRARLRPIAYGKAQLITCPPGVKCTEEMIHQLNRCTEIKLIKKGRLGKGIVIPAAHDVKK
jgi:outer membrane protein OmpA-like peptidoglycan-associated protein